MDYNMEITDTHMVVSIPIGGSLPSEPNTMQQRVLISLYPQYLTQWCADYSYSNGQSYHHIYSSPVAVPILYETITPIVDLDPEEDEEVSSTPETQSAPEENNDENMEEEQSWYESDEHLVDFVDEESVEGEEEEWECEEEDYEEEEFEVEYEDDHIQPAEE